MGIGFQRSVLSGAARHGVGVTRGATDQRRNSGAVDYGEDPYQDRRKAKLPQLPEIPDTAPTFAPFTPVARGGPGGYTDKKGVSHTYGYGQDDGPYSGFNTATGLDNAIGGRTARWLDDLRGQAGKVITGYETTRADYEGQASKGRAEAVRNARQQMPTYGELDPALAAQAYSRLPGQGVRLPMGPEFLNTRVGEQGGQGVAFFGGPQVPQDPGTAAYVTEPIYNPRPAFGSPKGVFHATTPGSGNALSANVTRPDADPSAAGLGLALGPYQTRQIPREGTGYGGWTPQAQPEAMSERQISYDPAADYAAAMATQQPQLDAIDAWTARQRSANERKYAPSFADMNALGDFRNADIAHAPGMTPDFRQVDPSTVEYDPATGEPIPFSGSLEPSTAGPAQFDFSVPENQFRQIVARDAYGVDENVAAGMYSDEWQTEQDLNALRDANAMSQETLDRNAFDQYGVPYSQIPEDPSATQQVSEMRAQDALDTFNATGYWPDDYEAAQKAANDPYGPLSDELDADSKAVLQAANITPEQATEFIRSGDLEAALADLESAFNPEAGLDEATASGYLREIYAANGSRLIQLIRALRPELVPTDWQVAG